MQVTCISGSRYAERPTGFIWEGEMLVVETVAAEWVTPDNRGFVVRTSDGRIFELVYFYQPDEWQVRVQHFDNE